MKCPEWIVEGLRRQCSAHLKYNLGEGSVKTSTRWMFTAASCIAVAIGILGLVSCGRDGNDESVTAKACLAAVTIRPIAGMRTERFEGKVNEFEARCNGGYRAVVGLGTPWVDWQNYWAAGDSTSKSDKPDNGVSLANRDKRGLNGALANLEYQRMELIKFNLFDNNMTFEQYLTRDDGPTLKSWKEMRLRPDSPYYKNLVVAADGTQICAGKLIRFRTLTGICNDIRNPAMGSTQEVLARNAEFESTFPELERNQIAKNRHGGRISLLQPDPQVISRRLFTREQKAGSNCNQGHGITGSAEADCAYAKAPFFNVLAAFWIQFMTHDWFSHLAQARNDVSHVLTDLGCQTDQIDNVIQPLSDQDAAKLGCRKTDHMDAALIAEDSDPGMFRHDGADRLRRAFKTTRNYVTAWWDASQIYGYDEPSLHRVRRDPKDSAKLDMSLTRSGGGAGDQYGYLPVFRRACDPAATNSSCDPIQPEWEGQQAAAFPDNWSLGLSFLHNLFVREHSVIIDTFRAMATKEPNTDSGLRDPDNPSRAITYGQLSNDDLFEVARLIVAAEIAKIHTIEWTSQLLYDEPLYIGMNSNWSGLFDAKLGRSAVANIGSDVTREIVQVLGKSANAKQANQLYSALAAGAGIVGTGNAKPFPAFLPAALAWDRWNVSNPDDVNGGVNHFGSPFNFPEEFVSVYRLHPLVPDLLEFRELNDPNAIREKVAVIDTFRGKATAKLLQGGLANWALTMGRQRLGLLALHNHPQFLQNLDLSPRMDSQVDIAALDIIRDRERGIPRFNEFRRQIGLRQLTSFDDLVDTRWGDLSQDQIDQQRETAKTLREIYGQHKCDETKIITTAQLDEFGHMINDCLGHPNGGMVDNIEDLDTVVGYLAETSRPHGFAISETQFQIFILNASRRLFSDRFFTSSFRPEFYTYLGVDWVMNNGLTGKQMETGEPNGHQQEILPLKRILLRAMPELEPELRDVVNSFDPWARDRGNYYSLEWKPRKDAASDPAFH
jgi:Animal haem peroxidase